MQVFFYRHDKETPCIQVGKPLQDIIFWLKYNDEEVAKCASALLRNYGQNLGVSDLHSAKQLLLNFCSEAFNCIDADFLSLNPEQRSVDSIISKVHRANLCEMFDCYITSQMKLYPYIYNLECVRFDGQLKLQDDLYLYGPGQVRLYCLILNLKLALTFMNPSLMRKIYEMNRLGDISIIHARQLYLSMHHLNRMQLRC